MKYLIIVFSCFFFLSNCTSNRTSYNNTTTNNLKKIEWNCNESTTPEGVLSLQDELYVFHSDNYTKLTIAEPSVTTVASVPVLLQATTQENQLLLLTTNTDYENQVWQATKLDDKAATELPIVDAMDIGYSPIDKKLYWRASNHLLWQYDFDTQKSTAMMPESTFVSMTLSSNGKYLAVLKKGTNEFIVWDIGGAKIVSTYTDAMARLVGVDDSGNLLLIEQKVARKNTTGILTTQIFKVENSTPTTILTTTGSWAKLLPNNQLLIWATSSKNDKVYQLFQL